MDQRIFLSSNFNLKASGILDLSCTQPHVLSRFDAEVTFQDLEQKFNISRDNPEIFETAKKTLDKAKEIIFPKAVYQWFEFEKTTGKDKSGCIIQRSGDHVTFDFGYSYQFLAHARYVLISVFTTGQEFEKELQHTSSKGDPLEAYFLDLIGLSALEQVGETIKGIAEKQAGSLGWGVSPFLSPGSVKGWELEEQVKLCSLLPLEKIDVTFQNDSVLSPLKTVSCLIGMGPEYSSTNVGTNCRVCSKKDTCPMKQKQTAGTDCLHSSVP
ncbi:MAG: hypothetical protein ACQETR_09940 [Thermodesulfobacteriota bacterium]